MEMSPGASLQELVQALIEAGGVRGRRRLKRVTSRHTRLDTT